MVGGNLHASQFDCVREGCGLSDYIHCQYCRFTQMVSFCVIMMVIRWFVQHIT